LVYDWWTLYNRLFTPGQHHEAITSRPLLLGGVAKQSDRAWQKRPAVRLLYADAPDLKTPDHRSGRLVAVAAGKCGAVGRPRSLATDRGADFGAKLRPHGAGPAGVARPGLIGPPPSRLSA